MNAQQTKTKPKTIKADTKNISSNKQKDRKASQQNKKICKHVTWRGLCLCPVDGERHGHGETCPPGPSMATESVRRGADKSRAWWTTLISSTEPSSAPSLLVYLLLSAWRPHKSALAWCCVSNFLASNFSPEPIFLLSSTFLCSSMPATGWMDVSGWVLGVRRVLLFIIRSELDTKSSLYVWNIFTSRWQNYCQI